MDVGNEIGQKMRSAIKAKLTELGCYVDDELPDYVMVMVANKRTRVQMEDDLQLFLGNNTELFVNWLHQVLKKLQEVTVATPVLKAVEAKSKEISDTALRSDSKDRKSKEKKSKQKKSDMKKAKKKDKEKSSRKKDDKKIHKTKKKSKHHEMIRPNIPPLLMNMEKESEPSITDVFAGQILKNHGINLDPPKDNPILEKKAVLKDMKRPILPIIDPATIQHSAQVEPGSDKTQCTISSTDPKEDQIKEINQIEAKIQGLKQKLAEQLDSISDDEDFINIRTEAEELMNDFAEDVYQEVTQETPAVATPPLDPHSTIPFVSKPIEVSKEPVKDLTETLPQIELKLPKRPLRDRLGAREESRSISQVKEKTKSPERFTPDREPESQNQKSAKSRLGGHSDTFKKSTISEEADSDKPSEYSSKKLTSKVSLLENRRSRSSCASVVRVRPRPRGAAPASSLLLRAVADAHKSLLNTPNTKIDLESQQVKRALVLPMRRCVDAQKILIEVPADTSQDAGDSISLEGDMDSGDDKSTKVESIDNDKYIPTSLTKRIVNEYTPTRHNEVRTASKKDDSLVVETINIHNAGSTDKKTQFIVTMDGYHPNAFLAKKLQTEGLLADDEDINKIVNEKPKPSKTKESSPEQEEPENNADSILETQKRLSSTSEESATQVVITKEEKRDEKKTDVKERISLAPKRKASPIVFDVDKRLKTDRQTDTDNVRERTDNVRERTDNVRERTESVSSDHSHVTVTTVTNTHKYDSVPPLSTTERKTVWCRAFPACRYGSSCAFTHPRCKFLAACTRRNCVYSHSPNAPSLVTGPVPPSVASHVVPVANYKTISSVVPNMCKFYPNCVNPSCHFYHPKPCRYGNNCANKLECNFFHADVPPKWKYTV